MNACPDVGRSRPAMQCISVDFPDPEGPMTAVKLPAFEGHVDPGEGVDLGRPGPVGLGQVDGLRSRRGLQVRWLPSCMGQVSRTCRRGDVIGPAVGFLGPRSRYEDGTRAGRDLMPRIRPGGGGGPAAIGSYS